MGSKRTRGPESQGGEPRYTTITWAEYTRLQRDSVILDCVEADFERHNRGKSVRTLREQWGNVIDSGAEMQRLVDEAAEWASQQRAAVRPLTDPHFGALGRESQRKSPPVLE